MFAGPVTGEEFLKGFLEKKLEGRKVLGGKVSSEPLAGGVKVAPNLGDRATDGLLELSAFGGKKGIKE